MSTRFGMAFVAIVAEAVGLIWSYSAPDGRTSAAFAMASMAFALLWLGMERICAALEKDA